MGIQGPTRMRARALAPQCRRLLSAISSSLAPQGVFASFVSDVVSNSLRVLKTARQTSPTTIGYRQAAAQIIDKEGLAGLLTRGLGTRVLTNALQASLFTVVWKYLEAKQGL